MLKKSPFMFRVDRGKKSVSLVLFYDFMGTGVPQGYIIRPTLKTKRCFSLLNDYSARIMLLKCILSHTQIMLLKCILAHTHMHTDLHAG